MQTASRTRTLALMGAALAAVGVFFVRAWPTWGTVVDDAYISARYSEHLAAGYGLVYNAGEAPVEGYTNLAWTVLLAGARVLGLPMHQSMEAFGLLFGALGIVGLVLLGAALMDRPRQPWIAALPALFIAATPHYAIIATNGLETSQFFAAAVWAIWASWTCRGGWRWLAGLLLSTLALVRPEGIAVAGGVVLLDLIERRRQLTQVHTWAFLLPVVAVFGALEAWRYSVYGALIPNTGPAKANLSWRGALKLNVKYVGGDAEVWIGALVTGLIGLFASRWTWRKLLVACLVGGLTLVASRVYLWMPGARLLVLPLALASTLAVMPLARPAESRSWRRPAQYACGALLALCLVYVVTGDPTGLLRSTGMKADPTGWQRDRDRRHSVVTPNATRVAGQHLAQHLPSGARLATRDAGLLAWSVGTDIRVDETHPRALTLPHPDGKDVDWKALLAQPPEAIALTVNSSKRKPFYYSLERRIWRHLAPAEYRYLGRIEQHHRRHYDIYVRQDLDVPPLPADIVVNTVGRLPRTTVHVAD